MYMELAVLGVIWMKRTLEHSDCQAHTYRQSFVKTEGDYIIHEWMRWPTGLSKTPFSMFEKQMTTFLLHSVTQPNWIPNCQCHYRRTFNVRILFWERTMVFRQLT